jgi:hypothetical protein
MAVLTRDDVAYVTGSCTPATTDSPGWCVKPYDGATVQSGVEHDFLMLACRIRGAGPGTITMHSEKEIRFVVSDNNGHDVFVYDDPSQETPNDGPVVHVGDGRCARWRFAWDVRANDGRPLAPGPYSGGVAVNGQLSNPSAGVSGTSYGISLDVAD